MNDVDATNLHPFGMPGKFAKKLRSGEACFMAWNGIASPLLVETLMGEDYDVIVLDGQHGQHDKLSLFDCIAASATRGKPALARIPVGNFEMASQLCDAGATGIIAPMINSVEDARRFAAYVKFPPLGERSWGPNRALAFSGLNSADYLAKANDFTLAIAMIETRTALEVADEILAVPGIDGFLIGPSDLSISLLNGSAMDALLPEVDAALTHVLALAKKRGKIACTFAPTAERAGELSRRGYNLVSVGTDFSLVSGSSRDALAIAKRQLVLAPQSGY